MAVMLHEGIVAVDVLARDPRVDPMRMGAIGHSLGAKEALYLAAFDARVRAAVFSEGGLALPDSNWEAEWYLGRQCREPGFPVDHAQLLALVAPRAFLLIGGDSADGDRSYPTLAAARPAWDLMGRPADLGWHNHRQGHAFPPEARDLGVGWMAARLGG
jgi:dienelactone hydrolase